MDIMNKNENEIENAEINRNEIPCIAEMANSNIAIKHVLVRVGWKSRQQPSSTNSYITLWLFM